MATEVKHGPKPKFRVKLQQPATGYSLTITGYYTTKDELAAAGVTEVRFNSEQETKRRAELLAMRSAFIGGWLELWLAHGGTWGEGLEAFQQYPFSRVLRQLIRRRWWRR